MLPADEFTNGILSELINRTWLSIQQNNKFNISGKDLLPLKTIIGSFDELVFERIAEQVHVPAEDMHVHNDDIKSIEEHMGFQESRFVTFFEKKGFLLYDGLHAAGSVGNYIYRCKGIRFFWFDDGTIAFSSIHSQIDENGFSLFHEILAEAPLSEIEKLHMYWKDTNTPERALLGTEDIHFLIYSLANINVHYDKAFFLEYLVNPTDVHVLSFISKKIRSSLWASIFNYILSNIRAIDIDTDDFLKFILNFMRTVGIEPPLEEMLAFSRDLLRLQKTLESNAAQTLDKITQLLENQFVNTTEDTKTAQETVLSFKQYFERQTYKDIYVNDNPQENIARAILQAYLVPRSYREVPVRGGRTDILAFTKSGRFLYETKIWRGGEYYKQGLRELEEYLEGEKGDDLLDVFYIIFDPTKNNQAADYVGSEFRTIKILDKNVSVVIIKVWLPTPSKK
ncbi:MAG TPA: hypothetical protein VGB02_13275 [Pyrinomonadaceae bacterium]|jgi:hypothetical protein